MEELAEDTVDEEVVNAEIVECPLENQREHTDQEESFTVPSVGKDENQNVIHDFHRINITGDEVISVPEKDYKTASGLILDALRFREKYMAMAGQTFNPTTSRFLRKVDSKTNFVEIDKVKAERPYRVDGSFEKPYEGNWKENLPNNLDWN